MKTLLTLLLLIPSLSWGEILVCQTNIIMHSKFAKNGENIIIDLRSYDSKSILTITDKNFKTPKVSQLYPAKRQYIIDDTNLSLVQIWEWSDSDVSKLEFPLEIIKDRDNLISYNILKKNGEKHDKDFLSRIYLEKENKSFRKIHLSVIDDYPFYAKLNEFGYCN